MLWKCKKIVQKGHQLNEVDAKNLLSRGLIEVQDDQYYTSLDVARKTKQVPEYTRTKGLERDKLKQMVLQFVQNTGEDGATRETFISYLANALPERNAKEQNQRLVGNILSEMNTNGLIKNSRKHWIATTSID